MNYSSDKAPREVDNCNYKPHRNTPSFSSTLLDEIYNSIDGNEPKANGFVKVLEEKPPRGEESMAKMKVAVRRRMSLMSELEKSALQEHDFTSTNPNKTGNDQTMKSKSKVYNKVYSSLKKVKQPSGKLTSFINSLFGEKKSKKLEKDKVVQHPSSVSSMRDGLQRTVRLHPPLPPEEAAIAKHVFKGIQDDDDDFSDASSDLFELDHKAMFGKSRFCEELPAYESAYFLKNRLV